MIAYLLASLPSPRLTQTPEIDHDTFLERCRGFVSDERWRDLAGASGDAPRDPAARAWHDLAAQIDDAVAVHRGANAQRDPTPYLRRPDGFRVDVAEAVEQAFARPDPGARERALDELRWRLSDELTVSDPDGFAALFARGVQLRLASRWAAWGAEAGWAALESSLRTLEAPHA